MTNYIPGPAKGKAQYIQSHGGAIVNAATITELPQGDDLLVLVVDNGPFEAAPVIDNERDFRDFNDPSDFRPKTALLVPREVVEQLLG